jgi:methylisocitrate lyase
MAKTIRELLKEDGIIIVPGCYDALSARIIESSGFGMTMLGGYSMGSTTGLTEPMMTMNEVLRISEMIAQKIGIPLAVDVGAGFGDATFVMRVVKEFIRAGVASVHIEDQYYPKRALYHAGIKYVIPKEDMVAKVKAAVKARGDNDFVLIARCDAREAQNGGLEDTIDRCKAYIDAGADIIMPYSTCAPSLEEAAYIADELPAPLIYVNSEGRTQYPKYTSQQIESAGFKLVVYNTCGIMSAAKAVKETMIRLKQFGDSGFSMEDLAPTRQMIEELIGLPELYKIEKEYRMG